MSKNYRILLKSESALGDVKKVTTVDHIFSSIPVRVIDAHHSLNGELNTKLLLWDINYPVEKRYKTELAIDGVFLNTNDPKYYLYEKNCSYYKSKVVKIDLDSLYVDFERCSKLVFLKDYKTLTLLNERFAQVISIYRNSFIKSKNIQEFYRLILYNWYSLLGFKHLGEWVLENMVSLSESGLVNRVIPKLILSTANLPEGVVSCIRHGQNIFEPPYFRLPDISKQVSNEFSDINWVEDNLETICNLISNGSILPSQKFISWALALTGLEHFGNDHSFFGEFAKYLNDNSISNLQLSNPKEDGDNFVEFSNSEVFAYKLVGNKAMKTIGNVARSINFVSAYIHLGRQGFVRACERWWMKREKTTLDYGIITE